MIGKLGDRLAGAQNIEEQQMPDPQDRPDDGALKPPAKKAAAKKAPAKKAAAKTAPAKAPAKKVPAKKVPAKKAAPKKGPAKTAHPEPPRPALEAATPPAALESAPAHAALPAGPGGERTTGPAHDSFGRGHAIPLSLALAAAGLVALVLNRLRRD